MNKQQLANKIWESANKMRSKIEANEYKDYILGFIFYKYLSEKQLKFLKEEEFSEEDIKQLSEEDNDIKEFIQNNIGYFIAYKNLFSTWLKMGIDFDVSNVRDALSAFNRLIHPNYSKVFNKIFDILQTGLSKLGENSKEQTKSISELIRLINDIPMDGKQDYDVLGFIYEYLISQFAANAGKKAGEFYTPHEVSVLMSELVANHLKERTEISIYDPTSGSGSLLINIGKSIAKYISDKNKIKYYAQELKENTYNLTRMNLVMRGIIPDNIVTRNGDTLEEDWPYFDESNPSQPYNPLYVDAVVSNPPYSQEWNRIGKESDPRYDRFGLAPKSKADYAFLLHDLYHIKNDGIMTIVLPHGVLFRGGEEGIIRKNLIEYNHIDAIIGLPANIFFGTGIPTIVMVLKKVRKNNDVMIVDASKGFIKEGKNNKLRSSDIKKIVDAVIKREDVEKYARAVSVEEIRKNEYNLNIPRYVDSSEPAESWDIYASMFGGIPLQEVNELNNYWKAFPTLQNALFSTSDIPYVNLKVEDVKKAIQEHEDIQNFEALFLKRFDTFGSFLKKEWIENVRTVEIEKSKITVSNEIFNRLETIPLIDKYEAYQFFDDAWGNISTDLEMIQTEGFEATKKVDPNLVIKKKDGTEKEVQEGWKGHIIPFALIQSTTLSKEYNSLKEKEKQLTEITSEYSEIIDSLTEEEKELNILNEDNSAFVSKEVTKKVKELRKDKELTDEDRELLDKLNRYENLVKEEKKLKKEVKDETARLHNLSKETIEALTDDEVKELLYIKWIENLLNKLNKLPDAIVDKLVSNIQTLKTKYEITYYQVQNEINETEKLLASMIDELEGSEFDMKGLNEFKAFLLGE